MMIPKNLKDPSLEFEYSGLKYTDLQSITKAKFFTSGLNIIHINIRSLKAHFDDLKELLSELLFKPSIIVLSELWLEEGFVESYELQGYTFEYSLRKDDKYGGCGCYVIKSLNYIRLPESELMLSECENISLELKVNESETISLGCIYRAPRLNYFTFCDSLPGYLSILSIQGPIILCGDWNLDYLQLHKHHQFFYTLFEHSLRSCIVSGTRITDHSCTSIDGLFTSLLGIECMAGTIASDISDHLPIYVSLNLGAKLGYMKRKNQIYNQVNFERVNRLLKAKNLNLIVGDDDLDRATGNLLSTCSDVIKACTVSKPFNRKKVCYNPWFTLGLKKSYNKKLRLYRAHIKNRPNVNIAERYKAFLKIYKKAVSLAKRLYYKKQYMDEKNIRKKWDVLKASINLKKSGKNSISQIKSDNDNELISDSLQMSNKFNEFFVNIGDNLAKKIPDTNLNPLDAMTIAASSFAFHEIPLKDMLSTLHKLNSKKSQDIYGISNALVKHIAEIICSPLHLLFNRIIQTNIFPQSLKTAMVIPLFKVGDKTCMNNYRPISILPIFGKIFEKIIFSQLSTYFLSNDLIAKQQFGFQAGISTSMALVSLYNYILSGLNNKELSAVLFVDLSKAFDTISHKILLDKLEKYGLMKNSLNLLNSYLSCRKLEWGHV